MTFIKSLYMRSNHFRIFFYKFSTKQSKKTWILMYFSVIKLENGTKKLLFQWKGENPVGRKQTKKKNKFSKPNEHKNSFI